MENTQINPFKLCLFWIFIEKKNACLIGFFEKEWWETVFFSWGGLNRKKKRFDTQISIALRPHVGCGFRFELAHGRQAVEPVKYLEVPYRPLRKQLATRRRYWLLHQTSNLSLWIRLDRTSTSQSLPLRISNGLESLLLNEKKSITQRIYCDCCNVTKVWVS